jgi:hypothetical protein
VPCSILVPLVLALAPGVFTVDDDGPADFPGIIEAVASLRVAPGSTLLVAPGDYGHVLLNKPLHVLPLAGQSFSAVSFDVVDVEFFSLVGAKLAYLTAKGVPGPSLVDRCTVIASDIGSSTLGFYFYSQASFEDCAALVVERSAFRGTDGCYSDGPSVSTEAIEVVSSTISFVDCWIRGGNATGIGCTGHYPVSGCGVRIRKGSDVLFAGCQVGGGEGAPNENAAALDVQTSRVVVRGTRDDSLHAAAPAPPLVMDGASNVLVSGVTVLPDTLPRGARRPRPAEPFLALAGGELPGAQLRLDLYGPAGALAVVGGSLGMGVRQLAGLSDALWLDPATLFLSAPVVLSGADRATSLFGHALLGPSVVGFHVVLQAWVDPLAGAGPWLTNPVVLVFGG